MTGRPVLGVDFGTTKTYFSKCPADDPSPTSVDFGDGKDGIPSAILYRRGKEPLVGQTALDEYGEAAPSERAQFRLVTNFKADLARSEEARAAAADFLAAVLYDARKQRLDVEPKTRQVLFGIPSEADDLFRMALEETAQCAGFGTPFLVDEPKGAVLHHLRQRDISVDQALEGVLVVDFGGGTCDFAFLERGRIVHSWGDMLLGGRLFDDLFFQWFLEQNPGLESSLETRGDAYFVRSHLCREVKEFFSRSMARDRGAPVSKVLHGYGSFVDLSWEEFRRRGESYRPSHSFLNFYEETLSAIRKSGHSPSDQIPERNEMYSRAAEPLLWKEFDLFGWFRESLLSGLHERGIVPGRISLAILAGGSSLWPFVGDILREELPRLDDQAIVRSDRPYSVISLGISLLPALKKRFARTRQALKDELPRFLEELVAPALAKRCAWIEEKMALLVTDLFFRKEIRPLLEDFRKTGGSAESLRRMIEARTAAAEPVFQKHFEEQAHRLLAGIREETRELLSEWFSLNGIALPRRELSVAFPPEDSAEPLLSFESPGMDGMLDVVGTVILGIFAAGGALLCGGSGTALVVSGPVGMAVGGVLGASAAYLLARYGKERMKEMVEGLEMPPRIAAFLLDEKRIASLEKELAVALKKHLELRLAPLRKQMDERILSLVLEEMDALNEINSF
jgi:hypothetical protein